MQLAADRAARERRRVVVHVVGARVGAQGGAGRACVRRRYAVLFDLTRGRRCGEQRHHDRARDAYWRLVDVARNERLVRPVEDLRLELDRPVGSHLDVGVALRDGRRARRLVLGRELRVQHAQRAVTVLRRRYARRERDGHACRSQTEDQTPHIASLPLRVR
jgi:hypothetical protein